MPLKVLAMEPLPLKVLCRVESLGLATPKTGQTFRLKLFEDL